MAPGGVAQEKRRKRSASRPRRRLGDTAAAKLCLGPVASNQLRYDGKWRKENKRVIMLQDAGALQIRWFVDLWAGPSCAFSLFLSPALLPSVLFFVLAFSCLLQEAMT